MTRLTCALINVAVLTASPVLAVADDSHRSLGFGYCPPPVVPSCVDDLAQSRGHADVAVCGREVLRFARTLGSYRICLERESERAVRTGNEAIALFRCLAQHGRACLRDDATATER